MKLKLFAMSIQSWETTYGYNDTAKYVCLLFYNNGLYTYLIKKIKGLLEGNNASSKGV